MCNILEIKSKGSVIILVASIIDRDLLSTCYEQDLAAHPEYKSVCVS